MKCLYLLAIVFHIAAGCAIFKYDVIEIAQYQGRAVLLPCSCSDLPIKPHTLTWMTFRAGNPIEVFNDDGYRGRLHLFNNVAPANLSLLISDLRNEDDGYYRCSTGPQEYRDIRLYVPGCALSAGNNNNNNNNPVVYGHQGGSVLLPCSCSDPDAKPQTLTWTTFRAGNPIEVFNDDGYRGRLHLFNNVSPANLSLLISDLRNEDEGYYRCSTGPQEYRDIRITIKGKSCIENVNAEGRPDCKETTTDPTGPDLVTFCIV